PASASADTAAKTKFLIGQSPSRMRPDGDTLWRSAKLKITSLGAAASLLGSFFQRPDIGLRGAWEGHFHAGALAGFGLDAQAPAVQFGKAAHNRQAKAGTRFSPGALREGLGQPVKVSGRDAGAAIRHDQHGRAAIDA